MIQYAKIKLKTICSIIEKTHPFVIASRHYCSGRVSTMALSAIKALTSKTVRPGNVIRFLLCIFVLTILRKLNFFFPGYKPSQSCSMCCYCLISIQDKNNVAQGLTGLLSKVIGVKGTCLIPTNLSWNKYLPPRWNNTMWVYIWSLPAVWKYKYYINGFSYYSL